MTLDAAIMVFGAFVALLPFLQFPSDWTAAFSLVAGIIIVGFGIAVRRRGKRSGAPKQHAQPAQSAQFADVALRDESEE